MAQGKKQHAYCLLNYFVLNNSNAIGQRLRRTLKRLKRCWAKKNVVAAICMAWPTD